MLLDESFRERVRRNLATFDVHRAPRGPHRAAAVCVAIAEEGLGAEIAGLAAPQAWSREAAIILTRRAATLRRHAGQWALPGGRVDDGEVPLVAALREMEEEIGLRLGEAELLGTLDDYVTRSGFVITPVVLWAGAAATLAPNEQEVASVHRIRVDEFMREDAPLLEPSEDEGREILRMPVGVDWIAAPTAAVLYQFREVCVAGRHTRVAHYDQPVFARK